MGAILNALGAGFRTGLRTQAGIGKAARIGAVFGIAIAVAGYLWVALT